MRHSGVVQQLANAGFHSTACSPGVSKLIATEPPQSSKRRQIDCLRPRNKASVSGRDTEASSKPGELRCTTQLGGRHGPRQSADFRISFSFRLRRRRGISENRIGRDRIWPDHAAYSRLKITPVILSPALPHVNASLPAEGLCSRAGKCLRPNLNLAARRDLIPSPALARSGATAESWSPRTAGPAQRHEPASLAERSDLPNGRLRRAIWIAFLCGLTFILSYLDRVCIEPGRFVHADRA